MVIGIAEKWSEFYKDLLEMIFTLLFSYTYYYVLTKLKENISPSFFIQISFAYC